MRKPAKPPETKRRTQRPRLSRRAIERMMQERPRYELGSRV